MTQQKDDDEVFDRNRILWTLDIGQTPMRRIYSTLKHLHSKLSFSETEALVEKMVSEGVLVELSHPVNPKTPFYAKKTADSECFLECQ